MNESKILVIDDEPNTRQLLTQLLRAREYSVEVVEDGSEALDKVKDNFFNLLITDLRMPVVGGVDVLKKIKRVNPYIEVIIITGYPSIDTAVEAMKIGAADYICKPFDIKYILQAVTRALDNQKTNVNQIELGELTTLLEINRSIAVADNLDSILRQILDSALSLVKAKRGSILLLDEKTNELSIKAARGLNDEVIKNTRIKLDESIWGKVFEDGTPLLVTDIEHDDRFRRKNRSEYKTSSFISLLLIVKHSGKNAMGVINITDKVSGESFTEREQMLLSLLAGQAGAVIENYRLYSQLQDKIEHLKNTIAELNETQNSLIQIEKMAAVGQLVFDIAHEIRNPLGIILGGVELLKNNIDNSSDLVKESIERITHAVDRANNIIVDFLKFSRISKLDSELINICDLMDEVLPIIRNPAEVKRISISRNYHGKDVRLRADTAMLRQAIFNLCSNAIDAMSQGGRLTLSVDSEQETEGNEGSVTISIQDTGGGIPQSALPKIFDPFFTTKEAGKGTGLGLSIVRTIIDRHKGTINAESEINKGTKFTIKLPAAESHGAKQRRSRHARQSQDTIN